jgi:hypothetical protein
VVCTVYITVDRGVLRSRRCLRAPTQNSHGFLGVFRRAEDLQSMFSPSRDEYGRVYKYEK